MLFGWRREREWERGERSVVRKLFLFVFFFIVWSETNAGLLFIDLFYSGRVFLCLISERAQRDDCVNLSIRQSLRGETTTTTTAPFPLFVCHSLIVRTCLLIFFPFFLTPGLFCRVFRWSHVCAVSRLATRMSPLPVLPIFSLLPRLSFWIWIVSVWLFIPLWTFFGTKTKRKPKKRYIPPPSACAMDFAFLLFHPIPICFSVGWRRGFWILWEMYIH